MYEIANYSVKKSKMSILRVGKQYDFQVKYKPLPVEHSMIK